MSVDYLLHESSVGYAVFKVRMQADSIGNRLKEVQEQHTDLSKFGKMVELISFAPFQGAQQALENANDISEGLVSPYLRTVLEAALPKAGKKNKVSLGVTDKNLAGAIKDSLPGLQCETGETSEIVADLLRGVRLHSEKLLGKLQEGDVGRAQLGLGHAYSRAKVKFSVQKNDNHIIQAIATIDQLDKACNTFAMRVREWYGWHFPELVRIASDNSTYAKLALFIGDKKTLSEESLHDLAALVGDDEATARSIIDAARVSMGQDISEEDMENVTSFAKRVVSLTTYRKTVGSYLVEKMGSVAPNVAALIGETVGARLIQKAGSLTNLAKYPASTVQILGAEKALFRALKTKGNTPKYGLIYHSSFIGRAGAKNKGRISRFLANKTSIASRIDLFSEAPSTKFGLALRDQVEERLEFYATGKPPTKNQDAMKSALASLLADSSAEDPTAGAEEEAIPAPGVTGGATEAALRKEKKKLKEGKKDKKRRSDADGDVSMADAAVADPAVKGAELAEEVERGNAGERKEKKKDKKDNKRRRSEGAGEGEVDDEEEERRRRKKEKKEKRKSGAS